MRLWDPASGQLTATLEGHTPASAVCGVAFSRDGRRLASASTDWTVRLWDPASGQPTTASGQPTTASPLKGHNGQVNAVALSSDGRQLASASADNKVRPWDPASGQSTATLQGHTGAVNAVAFSPDGCQLASASDDGTVHLWDAQDPATISQLKLGAPIERSRGALAVLRSLPTPSSFSWRLSIAPPELRGPSRSSRPA